MPLKQDRYEYFMCGASQGLSSTPVKLDKLDEAWKPLQSSCKEQNIGSRGYFGTRGRSSLRYRYAGLRNSTSDTLTLRNREKTQIFQFVGARNSTSGALSVSKREISSIYQFVGVRASTRQTSTLSKREISPRYHFTDVRTATRQNIASKTLNRRKPLSRYHFVDVRSVTCRKSAKTTKSKISRRYRFVDVGKVHTEFVKSRASKCIVSVNGFEIKGQRFVDVRLFYIVLAFVDVRKIVSKRLAKISRFGGVRNFTSNRLANISRFGGVGKGGLKQFKVKSRYLDDRIIAYQRLAEKLCLISHQFEGFPTTNADAKVCKTEIFEKRIWKLDIWIKARHFARIINLSILVGKIQRNICSGKPQKHDLPNKIPGHFSTCSDNSDIKSIRDLNLLLRDRTGSTKHTPVSFAGGGRPFTKVRLSNQSTQIAKFRPFLWSNCDVTDDDCRVGSTEALLRQNTSVGVVSESKKAGIIQDYGESSELSATQLRLINIGYIEPGATCYLPDRCGHNRRNVTAEQTTTDCLNHSHRANTSYQISISIPTHCLESTQENIRRLEKSDRDLSDDVFATRRCDVTIVDSSSEFSEIKQRGVKKADTEARKIRKFSRKYTFTGKSTIFKHWIAIMTSFWLCMHPTDCAEVGGDKQCPTGCKCYSEGKAVQCDGQDFKLVPSMIPTSAINLSLAENLIQELRGEPFTDLGSLKILNLTNNQVQVIRETAFVNLKNLSTLDLTGNKLRGISPISYSFLKKVKDIRLRRNPIEKLISWNFLPVAETLISLDLGELSSLNGIASDAFKGLDKLQTIKLDSGLRQFPNLQYLSAIRDIDLSGNNFEQIQPSAFKGLGRLSSINLSNCGIKWIAFGSFKDLTSLQIINLSNNKLATLDHEMFVSNLNIQRIDLRGNNWECNCELKYFVRWWKGNPSFCKPPTKCPRCSTPTQYREFDVTKFSNSSGLDCPTPIKRSKRYYIKAGSSMNIPCPTIKPSPKTLAPKVMWTLQNGSKVWVKLKNVKVRIQVLDTGALNFSKVTLEDKGTYRCSVTNPNGTVATSTVYLNVMANQTNGITPAKIYPISSYATYITTTARAEKVTTAATRTRKRNRPVRPKVTSWTSKPINTPWAPSGGPTPVVGIRNSPGGPDIRTGTSEQQVKQITKAVVGSFVGVTILAAILLAILYTVKRRKVKRDRASTAQVSNRIPRAAKPDETKVYQPDRQYMLIDSSGTSMTQRNSRACNTPDDFAINCRNTVGMPAPLHQQISRVGNDVRDSPMTLHILPPPPEEILHYETARGRPMTTQSPANMTSQHESLFSSKQASFTIDTPDKMTLDPLQKSVQSEQGYDSLRSSKQTIPPAMKPINGAYLTHDNQPITTSQRDLLTNLATSCQEVVLSKLHRHNSQTIPKELSNLNTNYPRSLIRSSSHGQMRDTHASLTQLHFNQRPKSNLSTRICLEDNSSGLINNRDAALHYLRHNRNSQPHYRKTMEKKPRTHQRAREEYRKAIQNSTLDLDDSQGYYDVMIDTNGLQPAKSNGPDTFHVIKNSQDELEAQAMDLRNIPEIHEQDLSSRHSSTFSSDFSSHPAFSPNQIFQSSQVQGYGPELVTTPKTETPQWNEEMLSHETSQSKITRRHAATTTNSQKMRNSSQQLNLSPNEALIHFEADESTGSNCQEFAALPPPSTNGFQYLNHTKSQTMESIYKEGNKSGRNTTKAKSFEAFVPHKETKI